MQMIETSAFRMAERYIGIKEIAGADNSARIMSWLTLDATWPQNDETPWCSAFVNEICWQLRLPRSKSLLARSWLGVGVAIDIEQAWAGFDVVILQRGSGTQPGPENMTAPGHVGFYAGHNETLIELLGGNQADSVSVARYPRTRILGIRRLYGAA